MKSRIISVITAVVILIGVFHGGECLAVAEDVQPRITTGAVSVSIDKEFGDLYLDMSGEDFMKLGFELGDGVDLSLSNGYRTDNIPVYNGYYAKYGRPEIVVKPDGSVVIAASRASFEKMSDVEPGDKALITFREKGAYEEIQETLNLVYSDKRSDFDSAEQFANFYEIKGGKLKKGLFYRSSSPVNNKRSRAPFAEKLLEAKEIKHIINLSDTVSEADNAQYQYNYFPRYYNNMRSAGNVAFLNLNSDYRSKEFASAVSNALLKICDKRGPYLIHCGEGKDRTGFVSALILALSGADYEEIRDDYMKSYENYYGITESAEPEKYHRIVELKADEILYYLACASDDSGINLEKTDFKIGAVNYLRYGGLTNSQILYIKCLITDQ